MSDKEIFGSFGEAANDPDGNNLKELKDQLFDAFYLTLAKYKGSATRPENEELAREYDEAFMRGFRKWKRMNKAARKEYIENIRDVMDIPEPLTEQDLPVSP